LDCVEALGKRECGGLASGDDDEDDDGDGFEEWWAGCWREGGWMDLCLDLGVEGGISTGR
jgi:hypothetical protein